MKPKVNIVTLNPSPLAQTYEEASVITDSNTTDIKFFNSVLKEGVNKDELYIFLTQQDNFVEEDSVERLVRKFLQHELYSMVYSDLIICETDQTIHRQYYPAFHRNIFNINNVINVPFLMSGEIIGEETFDPNIEVLLHFLLMLKLARFNYMAHVQEPLLVTQLTEQTSTIAELELIRKCLEQ